MLRREWMITADCLLPKQPLLQCPAVGPTFGVFTKQLPDGDSAGQFSPRV